MLTSRQLEVPAGAAWWLSCLERYDALGLRGNWEDGTALHDLFANLLTKSYDAFINAATDVSHFPSTHTHTLSLEPFIDTISRDKMIRKNIDGSP